MLLMFVSFKLGLEHLIHLSDAFQWRRWFVPEWTTSGVFIGDENTRGRLRIYCQNWFPNWFINSYCPECLCNGTVLSRLVWDLKQMLFLTLISLRKRLSDVVRAICECRRYCCFDTLPPLGGVVVLPMRQRQSLFLSVRTTHWCCWGEKLLTVLLHARDAGRKTVILLLQVGFRGTSGCPTLRKKWVINEHWNIGKHRCYCLHASLIKPQQQPWWWLFWEAKGHYNKSKTCSVEDNVGFAVALQPARWGHRWVVVASSSSSSSSSGAIGAIGAAVIAIGTSGSSAAVCRPTQGMWSATLNGHGGKCVHTDFARKIQCTGCGCLSVTVYLFKRNERVWTLCIN